MIQEHYIYCALYFYYYYVSSASDHQALDPRGWEPLLEPWFPELWLCRQIIWQNTCNIANNIGGFIRNISAMSLPHQASFLKDC